MKLLFLTYEYNDEYAQTGIGKKITNQFIELGKYFEESYISGKKGDVYFIDNTEYSVKETSIFSGRKKRLKITIDFIRQKNITHIYVRYSHFADKNFIFFLESAKKMNCKIIMEIPTYPYDKEYKKEFSKKYLSYLIERKYRNKIVNYVDLIVTFSDDKEIFGISCINISNAINLSEIQLANKNQKESIVFSSVSSLEFWHGVDRFIYAVNDYVNSSPTIPIKFNIVGEGSEITRLKDIVSNNKHLKDVIFFHGFKTGQEIDNIYDETDIAVGSLGRHRSGLTNLKTLKNREYAAKGLPMIYSEIDPDFEGQSFVYKTTPDEEMIEIGEIIGWYQNLQIKPEEIRNYSKQFSWEIQMKKVIDIIEEK